MENNIVLFFWNLKDTLLFDIFQVISGRIYIAITALPFVIWIIYKFKKKALYVFLAAGIAWGVSDIVCYRILKPAFKRSRPGFELNLDKTQNSINEKIPDKKNYSMPSNHASNLFAVFIVYFIFVKRFWIPFLINSLLISFSRIVLVKHYPTDVLAGMFIGIFLGLLVSLIFKLFGIKPDPDGNIKQNIIL